MSRAQWERADWLRSDAYRGPGGPDQPYMAPHTAQSPPLPNSTCGPRDIFIGKCRPEDLLRVGLKFLCIRDWGKDRWLKKITE